MALATTFPNGPKASSVCAGCDGDNYRFSPQAVWDKAKPDGTVLDKLGPHNLVQSLEALWPTDQPHLAIADIRDWFASYVYLPRLRDPTTLDGALQQLFEDLAPPYAYAAGFDKIPAPAMASSTARLGLSPTPAPDC